LTFLFFSVIILNASSSYTSAKPDPENQENRSSLVKRWPEFYLFKEIKSFKGIKVLMNHG